MTTYPDTTRRWLITASVLAAAVMNTLDSTIANVALPHMQASVGASQDEISWVLTSYLVASNVFTPLTGWLAGRFGRKRLLMVSVIGFTIASGLCGIATSLGQIVGFRILQGMLGAALVPMSQAVLLDINPPERQGSAIALWTMGAVLGPIVGPVLGGWLTDDFTWRWVFYINLPVGILSCLGIAAFMPESRERQPQRLDMLGFVLLAVALCGLQVMLDRGQQLDWFSSVEICVEATAAGLFFYLFAVHTATSKQPFLDIALFKNSNFMLASAIGFLVGLGYYGTLVLLPPMLETLMNYPVTLAGLVTGPRGIGAMAAMMSAGYLVTRVDSRLLIAAGLALTAWSMWQMAELFYLGMNAGPVLVSGVLSGAGSGLLFVPLTTVAFATVAPSLRNQGAALFTLIRNTGSAVGISAIQALTVRNAAIVHSRLVETIRPDNPLLERAHSGFEFTPGTPMAAMNAQVTLQATMVSYVDSFWGLFVISMLMFPIILLLRRPKGADRVAIHVE